MELPKIKNENLPEELKKILGDADAEFDPIVDPTDVVSINLTKEDMYEERHQIAQALVQSRQKLNEYLVKQRKSEDV